jgi:anti-sigma factor RsiW
VRDRCRDVLERLVEAATGTLGPAEGEGIAGHLAACDRCRQEAAAIEAAVLTLRGAGRFHAPPGFWAQFTDRLNERIALDRPPATVRLRRWIVSPRGAWGTVAVTAALAITAVLRLAPTPVPMDPVHDQARTLVTDTMNRTLPSLAEMLEVMGAGFPSETDLVNDQGRP